MDVEKCLKTLSNASSSPAEKLAAFKFARANLKELLDNESSNQSITEENFKEIFNSDDVVVESEDAVFNYMKSYLDTHNKPTSYIKDMLEVVKIPLLSAEPMKEILKMVYGVKEPVLSGMVAHLGTDNAEVPTPRNYTKQTVKEFKQKKILSIGGWSTLTSGIIEMYDIANDSWKEMSHPKLGKNSFGVALLDDALMIIGGYKDNNALNTVESFDLKTKKVTSLSPMATAKHGMGVVVSKNKDSTEVYAIGGFGTIALKTVEKWDSKTGKWTSVENMNIARYNCGAVILDGKIYVVGGKSCDSDLNSVEVYQKKVWLAMKPMNDIRGYCTVAVHNKLIYAVGGYKSSPSGEGLNSLETFDSSKNEWTKLTDVIDTRGHVALCSLGNTLIYSGGKTNPKTTRKFVKGGKDVVLASPNVARQWNTLIPIVDNYS